MNKKKYKLYKESILNYSKEELSLELEELAMDEEYCSKHDINMIVWSLLLGGTLVGAQVHNLANGYSIDPEYLLSGLGILGYCGLKVYNDWQNSELYDAQVQLIHDMISCKEIYVDDAECIKSQKM